MNRLAMDEMLRMVPHLNRMMKVHTTDNGAFLTVPRRNPWWLKHGPLAWFFPVRREHVMQLDAVGRTMLGYCDGQATVEYVIDRMMKKFKLSFQEARVSVMQFIRQLVQRGVLALVMPREKEPPPAGR